MRSGTTRRRRGGMGRWLGAAATLLLLSGTVWAGADAEELAARHRKVLAYWAAKGYELGRKYELKESEEVPAWAAADPEALFRFAHMTDIHYSEARREILVEAIAFANEAGCAFTVITGDNAGSSDFERQQHFKEILDAHFAHPYYIVRGDNWPQRFGEVFGDADWGFRYGGVYFMGASLDRDVLNDGIGVFDEETWAWMRAGLEANAGRPVVFFMHENVVPPTFLDAGRLRGELERGGNVVATVTGHLHSDYETRSGMTVHLVGPSLGIHPEHGFKVFEVHKDHMTVRTVKRREGSYRYVKLYQLIRFPARMELSPPEDAGERESWLSVTGYDAPSRREIVFDEALAGRAQELLPGLMMWLSHMAVQRKEMTADMLEIIAETNRILGGDGDEKGHAASKPAAGPAKQQDGSGGEGR